MDSPPIPRKCGFWLGFLFFLYSLVVLLPEEGWYPVFLLAGSMVTLSAWRQVAPGRKLKRSEARPAVTLSRAAAALAALVAFQHGIIQGRTEWMRGNAVGASISLLIVTPLLCLLAWKLISAMGKRVV